MVKKGNKWASGIIDVLGMESGRVLMVWIDVWMYGWYW